MKILDDLLAKFGSQTVIIVCICILLVIFATIVYRMFKLKVYRKEIIELENQMNAVKSLPIQYRLGRVKGIGKNMPEVLEKYNLYVKEFDDLNSFQTNDIVPLINEIDEQLYYRKLTGAKSKLHKLKEEISNYETKSQDLLKRIEVITEVENEQRLEIIKIKEKYRAASDNFANVRFKIEDFVPSIPGIIPIENINIVAIPVTSKHPATSIVISDDLSPIPAPISNGTGMTLNTATIIC